MDAFNFSDHAVAVLEASVKSKQKIELFGTYRLELYDKYGTLLATRTGHNAITNVGLDYCPTIQRN